MTNCPTETSTASQQKMSSLHKTSGLFDAGFTNGDSKLVPLVNLGDSFDDDIDNMIDVNASRLLSSLGSLSSCDEELLEDGSGLPGSPTDGVLDLTGQPDFLEVFTDLNDFINEKHDGLDNLIPTSEEPNIDLEIQQLLQSQLTAKRTSDEAFGCELQGPNHDHDDYTSKKRKQMSPPTPSKIVVDLVNEQINDTTNNNNNINNSPPISKAEERYIERRKKNNIASRRSRQTRKQKFSNMELQAQELEKRNAILEEQVSSLEKVTSSMKQILLEKMSSKQN